MGQFNMEGLHCRLICNSASEHLNQLYTGFGELNHQGIIEVSLQKGPHYISSNYLKPYLKVVVNGQFTILYDNSDGYELIYPELDDIDFYFKRSFFPEYVQKLTDGHKIYPLGFNYEVYSEHDQALKRALWSNNLKDFFKSYVRASKPLSKLLKVESSIATSHFKYFEGQPKSTDRPLILFMARLWEPSKVSSSKSKSEREEINHLRATCIRTLRKEFGELFVGGLANTDFAVKQYPDCVLNQKNMARKANYLKLMHNASICIATTGLMGSVGWKMAEYIAGAKAIVSEKNYYEFPGDFKEGCNFLSFEKLEDCIENVAYLVDNPLKRLEMMKANQSYYRQFLRPDQLVLNSLKRVLDHQPKVDLPK
ncbi:hypothetical protein QQ020_05815 [Fulvivirgaceae bacterium BMA12]|uniref:Glycosyltransferase family 1 protein n=1 Tax=Agaribacillus aureus TaxID=3051825 RepID=A0ABT8L1D4_9BACT|nr:hypothetical protein [Fulvivirgaceae bacterium BMA12]